MNPDVTVTKVLTGLAGGLLTLLPVGLALFGGASIAADATYATLFGGVAVLLALSVALLVAQMLKANGWAAKLGLLILIAASYALSTTVELAGELQQLLANQHDAATVSGQSADAQIGKLADDNKQLREGLQGDVDRAKARFQAVNDIWQCVVVKADDSKLACATRDRTKTASQVTKEKDAADADLKAARTALKTHDQAVADKRSSIRAAAPAMSKDGTRALGRAAVFAELATLAGVKPQHLYLTLMAALSFVASLLGGYFIHRSGIDEIVLWRRDNGKAGAALGGNAIGGASGSAEGSTNGKASGNKRQARKTLTKQTHGIATSLRQAMPNSNATGNATSGTVIPFNRLSGGNATALAMPSPVAAATPATATSVAPSVAVALFVEALVVDATASIAGSVLRETYLAMADARGWPRLSPRDFGVEIKRATGADWKKTSGPRLCIGYRLPEGKSA